MRTFTCFTFEAADAAPTESFILARDETRARELARRELSRVQGVSLELREGGKLIWPDAA